MVCQRWVQSRVMVCKFRYDGMFRLCLSFVQSLFRSCSDFVQTLLKQCSNVVQALFKRCRDFVNTFFKLYVHTLSRLAFWFACVDHPDGSNIFNFCAGVIHTLCGSCSDSPKLSSGLFVQTLLRHCSDNVHTLFRR